MLKWFFFCQELWKMSVQINFAESPADFEYARQLFLEYADSLGFSLCFQGFDEELEFLPGKYAAPNGCILLAKIESVSVGCAALRPISNNVCEMKRLYVKPDYRGNGLGRKLAYKIVQLAIEKKYLKMQLDTLSSMHSAIGLYQSLGFVETTPYYNNPHPDVMFFEKTLDGAVVT
jgi:ribosomal protein S18 acetylase RimI-like enzyme